MHQVQESKAPKGRQDSFSAEAHFQLATSQEKEKDKILRAESRGCRDSNTCSPVAMPMVRNASNMQNTRLVEALRT